MNRLLVLALFLATLSLGGCALFGGPPPIPPWVDADHVHFSEPVVDEGDPAPDFTLATPDGTSQVTLSELRGKPVVLVFGSYT